MRKTHDERRTRVSGRSFSHGPLVEPYVAGNCDEGRNVAAFGQTFGDAEARRGQNRRKVARYFMNTAGFASAAV